MWQQSVSGAWMHSIFGVQFFTVITGNDVFKNKVIPGPEAPGHSMQTVPVSGEKAQNMQVHERPQLGT